jgi:hypothetical protein
MFDHYSFIDPSKGARAHNVLAFVFFPLPIDPMFYAFIFYFLYILDAVKPYHARGSQQRGCCL